MRLSQARVEQALSQFEAHVLPDDHPSMARIKGLWGDHTYFLAPNGSTLSSLSRVATPALRLPR